MRFIYLFVLVLLSGCTAKLTFIDKTNGEIHLGTTGTTMQNQGDASAIIQGKTYTGTWMYSDNGGSYSLSEVSLNGETKGTVSTTTMSTSGNGILNLRSGDSSYIRCVFSFSAQTRTGIGHCVRNDNRQFDLTIYR